MIEDSNTMYTVRSNKLLHRINNLIFGDSVSFSLENKIYNVSTFFEFIICLFLFLWNYYLELSLLGVLVIGINTLIYALLYYFARVKRRFNSTIYVIVTLCFLSILWFVSEGSKGSTPLIYILSLIIFLTISKSKYHLLYLLYTLINLVLLYLGELFFLSDYIIKYSSEASRALDLNFTYTGCLIISFFIINQFKANYDKENTIINTQKKELQELIKIKDKFFSIIAHDLRSPFNAILGFSRLLSEKGVHFTPEKLKKFTDLTYASAENVYQLLENLLAWSRMHQGTISFDPGKIRVKDNIERSYLTFKVMAETKGVGIRHDIDAELYVYTDNEMLDSILRNLISNAIKFSNQGGIITITAEQYNSEYIKISVSDTGIGMNETIINNLFQENNQVNRRGTANESSSGLGLLLCKDFVERVQGQIWVESVDGEGSTFSFTLPVCS